MKTSSVPFIVNAFDAGSIAKVFHRPLLRRWINVAFAVVAFSHISTDICIGEDLTAVNMILASEAYGIESPPIEPVYEVMTTTYDQSIDPVYEIMTTAYDQFLSASYTLFTADFEETVLALPVDSDLDGIADEHDGCPFEYSRSAPGECGCEVSEADCALLMNPIAPWEPTGVVFYRGYVDELLAAEAACASMVVSTVTSSAPRFGQGWFRYEELRTIVKDSSEAFIETAMTMIGDQESLEKLTEELDNLIKATAAKKETDAITALKAVIKILGEIRPTQLVNWKQNVPLKDQSKDFSNDLKYLLETLGQYKKLLELLPTDI